MEGGWSDRWAGSVEVCGSSRSGSTSRIPAGDAAAFGGKGGAVGPGRSKPSDPVSVRGGCCRCSCGGLSGGASPSEELDSEDEPRLSLR